MPVWKREESYIKFAGEQGKEGVLKKEPGRHGGRAAAEHSGNGRGETQRGIRM